MILAAVVLSLVAAFVEQRLTKSSDLSTLLALAVIGLPTVIAARRWSHDLRRMGVTRSDQPTSIAWRGVAGNTAAVLLSTGVGYLTFHQTQDRWLEALITSVTSACAFFSIGRAPYVGMFQPRRSEFPKLRIQQIVTVGFTLLVALLATFAVLGTDSAGWPLAHEIAVAAYLAFLPILVASIVRVRRRFARARRSWGS